MTYSKEYMSETTIATVTKLFSWTFTGMNLLFQCNHFLIQAQFKKS